VSNKPTFRLYLITERARMRPDPASALASALSSLPEGAAAVQLREPDLLPRDLLELGRTLLPVCRKAGAPLLINERLDVARALDADGVHLRARSVSVADARSWLGPNKWIGASCHSRSEVESRREADFVTIGPVFETPSKLSFGAPLGLDGVRASLFEGAPPAFGLGGVNLATARPVLSAGAFGLAAIRAIWERDPASQTARLWAILGP
jgi:thiamine-phosphate pyrophosphorylase